jgi:prepilin-type N-terminal cleavage/methylation domain-containing protein/prepilin-type processing-associated H-X9-DG protein
MTRFRHCSTRKRAFTLVELLVVIAIIGILVALLLPAVQAAREAARRMQCSNNAKQIGLAFHNYHETFKALPMAYFLTDPPLNSKNWGTMLLPFLEQQPLHDQYNSSLPPWHATNAPVCATPLSVFVCPSAPGGLKRLYTALVPAGAFFTGSPQMGPVTCAPSDWTASTGVLAPFSNFAYGPSPGGQRHGVLQDHINLVTFNLKSTNRDGNMARTVDGTSNTMAIAERTGGDKLYSKTTALTGAAVTLLVGVNGGGWADGVNGENWLGGAPYSGYQSPINTPTFAGGPCAINCTNVNGRGYHGFHPGGCHFLLLDGSVQFLSETIAQFGVAARITREKGEVVTE